jgi:hypothetical protein
MEGISQKKGSGVKTAVFRGQEIQMEKESAGWIKKKVYKSRSDIQRLKCFLSYLSHLPGDLFIQSADRASIRIGEILKGGAHRNAVVGLTTLLVIDVPAYRADVFCGNPGLKTPCSYLSFSLHSTNRADIGIRKVFERGAGRDSVVGFAPQGGVDITAIDTFVLLCFLHRLHLTNQNQMRGVII